MVFSDPEDSIIQQPSRCVAETRLWLAVLEQAWTDATQPCEDSEQLRRRDLNRAEARAWVRSKENGPGSLKWILQMTGIETTATRLQRRILEC